MSYRDLYDEVITSGKYRGTMEKIEALAQLIYRHSFDGVETTTEAVWDALERFEDMTGRTFDPTQEQFDCIEAAII